MKFSLPGVVLTASVSLAATTTGVALYSYLSPTTPTSTNIPGAIGPQGQTGPIGPMGPQGRSGEKGEPGTNGANGTNGADGANGVDGSDGSDGRTGATGPMGPTGQTGAIGAQGPTGPQGETGSSGAQGATGATGANGAQGATGATGATGAQGIQGVAGPMGPTGPSGIVSASLPLIYDSTNKTVSLDLNAFDHLASLGYLQFNTSVSASDSPGRLLWNNEDGTLNLQGKDAGVTLQLGQESVQLVANQTGAAIMDGRIVKVIGSAAGRILVELADNSTVDGATGVIGLATQNIADGGQGYVTTYGVVHGQNTTGMSDGDPIYLGSAGGFTNVRPTNGRIIQMGFVLVADAANGSIYVNPQQNFEPVIGSICTVPSQAGTGTFEWTNFSQDRYVVVCKLIK